MAFHALVCTLAVSVSTPSRSNRQARTFSGRPSTADPHCWCSWAIPLHHACLRAASDLRLIRPCDSLDGSKSSVRQSKGEVFGFSLEVGDEGVQAQRVGGWASMACMNAAACSVRSFQCSTAKPADSTAARNSSGVTRWLRRVGRPTAGDSRVRPCIANCDVPQGKPTPVDQHPACFGVQARLVGHVHLNMLADGDIESAVGKRKFGDVCLTNGYPVVQSDESIEPTAAFRSIRR